jgi:hypothetical protein
MIMADKIAKLDPQIRMQLVGELSEGTLSLRELELKYGIARSQLSDFTLKNGIQRGHGKAKRGMHDALMLHAEDSDCTFTTGNPAVDAAAKQTASVGRRATKTAVNIINRLHVISDPKATVQLDEKQCLTVANALAKAWESYAHINKLNDQPVDDKPIVIEWEKAT